jgi:hypothetical protein
MLAKQHQVEVSGEPITFSEDLTMAAVTSFSTATVYFFAFGPLF